MSNHFFQKMKEKTKSKQEKQKAEQRIREANLSELQSELNELQNKSGFHIPHPIKVHKKRQEIKQLEKEISDYKDRKKAILILIGIGIVIVSIFVFYAVKSNNSSDPTNLQMMATENSRIVNDMSVTTEPAGEIKSSISTEPTTETETTVLQSEATAHNETTLPVSNYTSITSDDLSVTIKTDFSHCHSDVVTLGENEGVTISIIIAKPNITVDDLVLFYDESLLDMKIREPVNHNNSTLVEVYVKGKVSGSAELGILTAYDSENLGEEANGYLINIHKLDADNGKIVYTTPHGEKFHNSSSCAGTGAIQTTYFDAQACGNTPCKKCS